MLNLKCAKFYYKVSYNAGRNNSGSITVRHRGGIIRSFYKLCNFYSYFENLTGLVVNFLKRNENKGFSKLALIYVNKLGIFCHILAHEHMKLGDVIVINGPEMQFFEYGSIFELQKIPSNSRVFNIEIKAGHGGQIARSAGSYCRVLRKFINSQNEIIVQLELPSKEMYYVSGHCLGTYGRSSNGLFKFKKLGKAGITRRLGFRPAVRGVAMNPVDHPHGGGEGKTSGGRTSVSPWCIKTKGYKTISKKKKLSFKLFERKVRRYNSFVRVHA